jgi:hypothetical protein
VKPNFANVDAPDSDKMVQKLNHLFTRIATDNFDGKFLTGTTAGTADTQFRVKHGMVPRPRIAIVSLGDIYIKSIDNDSIDVRSSKTTESFEILALR